MKKWIFLILLASFHVVGSTVIRAQTAVKVPLNEVLPVVVVQEDCPLKVERFSVLSGSDKRFLMAYSVKNRSSKNVVSYRIMRSYDTGTGFFEYGAMPTNKILYIGQSAGTLDRFKVSDENQVYNGKLKALAFIMIVEVTFEDGSIYSAKTLLEAFDARVKTYGVE